MEEPFRPGVLVQSQIIKLVKDGIITGTTPDSINPDPSAFDLHLGNRAYLMKGSIKADESHRYIEAIPLLSQRLIFTSSIS